MSNMNAPVAISSLSETTDQSLHTIASVRFEYGRADCFCIEVQSFCGKAGIPAINELRNSGKHLLDSIDDSGGVVDQENLNNAVGHARRAAYEAYEMGILIALAMINKFKTDYGSVVVSKVLPDFSEILHKAETANRTVEEGRSKDFKRDGDHTDRMNAFRELREICNKIDACRDEVNKLVEEKLVEKRRDAKSVLLTYILIAIGILAFLAELPALGDWVGKHSWSPAFLKIDSAASG